MSLFIDYIEESVSAFLGEVSASTGTPIEDLNKHTCVECLYDSVYGKMPKDKRPNFPIHLLRLNSILHNNIGEPSLVDKLYAIKNDEKFKIKTTGISTMHNGCIEYRELVANAVVYAHNKASFQNYDAVYKSGEKCDFMSVPFISRGELFKEPEVVCFCHHNIDEAIEFLIICDGDFRQRAMTEFLEKNKIPNLMNKLYSKEFDRMLYERASYFKKFLHRHVYYYLSNRNNVVNWVMTDHWLEDQGG